MKNFKQYLTILHDNKASITDLNLEIQLLWEKKKKSFPKEISNILIIVNTYYFMIFIM